MGIKEINISDVKAEAYFPSTKFIENIGAVGIRVPVMLRKNGHGYMIVDGRAEFRPQEAWDRDGSGDNS